MDRSHAAALLLLNLPEREREVPGAEFLGPVEADPEGAGEQDLLEPVGTVDDYLRFSWQDELPPDAAFFLRIHDGSSPGGEAVRPELELYEGAWEPTIEERRALPDSIRVELYVEGRDGGRSLLRSWSAWRR